MWVARMKIINGTLINKDSSPQFEDIYECQTYINTHLLILEYICHLLQNEIDNKVDKKLTFRFGNYIRCYNVEQKRFADGFDY